MLQLKSPYRDGTTHIVMSPLAVHAALGRTGPRIQYPSIKSSVSISYAPLPDVEEAVADYQTNPAAVEAHVRTMIDRIIELTPRLARRLVVSRQFRRLAG